MNGVPLWIGIPLAILCLSTSAFAIGFLIFLFREMR